MATWKKMVAESSAGVITQTSALATALAGGAANKVVYQSGSGATAFLAAGSANQVLKNTGSAPAWSNFLIVSDGSNSTTIAPAGQITFTATSNETTVVESSGAITIGLPDNVTVAGDLTVGGNDIKSSSATALTLSGANVTTAADLTVTGDLVVSGDTTTLNTATLAVEDKKVKLADVSSPTTTTANGAGLQVETSGTEAEWPELSWDKDGAMNGWTLSDHTATTAPDYNIQVTEHTSGAPASGDNAAGVGSMYYDTSNNNLYLRVA